MIITADLHLTDRSQDEYRWAVFDWLEQIADKYDHEVPVLILGDLTDRKDNHSARLVNRIIDRLYEAHKNSKIYFYILKGNHDFVDPKTPFFKFLSHLSWVEFITDPYFLDIYIKVLMLPYSKEATFEWTDPIKKYQERIDLICTHCTVKGSVASNGYELDSSITPSFFEELGYDGLVLSGDIHVPQRIRNVVYVGSPYHVHFGDSFEPRILEVVVKNDELVIDEHRFKSPKRLVVTIESIGDIEKYDIDTGDQVKVRHFVKRENLGDFEEARAAAQSRLKELGADIVDYALKVVEPGEKVERGKIERRESGSKSIILKRDTPYTIIDRFAQVEGVAEEYVEMAKRIIGQA